VFGRYLLASELITRPSQTRVRVPIFEKKICFQTNQELDPKNAISICVFAISILYVNMYCCAEYNHYEEWHRVLETQP
jgi:hypothetical protein